MIIIFALFLLSLLVITSLAIVRTDNLFVAVMLTSIFSLLMAANFFILDAADSTHLWNSFIPSEQNPHVKNPPRGFVSSANQHAADFTGTCANFHQLGISHDTA